MLARTYAEQAKTQYEELADRANVGRLMNNLGAVEFLLGKPEVAVDHFKQAFAVALELVATRRRPRPFRRSHRLISAPAT